MSQITHFCDVKFLAWKFDSVKFCDIDDNWYAILITDLPDFSLAATTLRLSRLMMVPVKIIMMAKYLNNDDGSARLLTATNFL